MSEPIFSVLSGKFSSGFTVSGFTGDNVSLNGTYNLMGNNPNRSVCDQTCYDSWMSQEPDYCYACEQATNDYFIDSVNQLSNFAYFSSAWEFWGYPDVGDPFQIYNTVSQAKPGYENFPTTGWIGPNGETLTFSSI